MLEVEVLRVCDAAFRNSRLAHRYEIKVGSSELLDAIFEECDVPLEERLPIMQFLLDLQDKAETPAAAVALSNRGRAKNKNDEEVEK